MGNQFEINPKVVEDVKVIWNIAKERELPIAIAVAQNFDTHAPKKLRMYANGGRIGTIPLNGNDLKYAIAKPRYNNTLYFDYLDQDARGRVSEYYAQADGQRDILKEPEYLMDMCALTKGKYTSTQKDVKDEYAMAEKRLATSKMLSKSEKKKAKGLVLCDIAYFMPPEWTGRKGKADFLCIDTAKGEIGLLTLKCRRAACIDGEDEKENGLRDCFNQMSVAIVEHQDEVVRDCITRYNTLVDVGVIDGEKADPSMEWKLFMGFIFYAAGDSEMRTKSDAVSICEQELMDTGKFAESRDTAAGTLDVRFMFTTNLHPDLDEMTSWEKFKN